MLAKQAATHCLPRILSGDFIWIYTPISYFIEVCLILLEHGDIAPAAAAQLTSCYKAKPDKTAATQLDYGGHAETVKLHFMQ